MTTSIDRLTYQNPVYPHYFADPFALRAGEFYYAYGTAPPDERGRQFPVLRSPDLVHWEYVRHALYPIETGVNYWAPEVAEKDGLFYMFYSASTTPSDDSHRIRVATSPKPDGPFIDSGHLFLPNQGFSIDPHPFRDPKTNQWYLFFATDYTEDEPAGTGLAVVPLTDDLMSVLDQPRAVIRASCSWQVYERNRDYKGRIWSAWHCVEGPFVVFRNDRYYCLYSAGAWYSENYGIGYAVAEHPMGPYVDDFAAHGPIVLKGNPERVVGPGHNSVVMGPDGKTQFLVYHAWDHGKTARRMCIDPIHWTGQGPRCDGPSTDPRPIPIAR
jgi:beta-xylosidase